MQKDSADAAVARAGFAAYPWLVVALLWTVCFFNYADRQVVFSVFPLIKREIGLSDIELGVVGGSFMWAYALFGPVAGWLGDRFPRKGLILGALVFWSACTAATAIAQNFWQLTLCRALGGLGEAFYFPAAMSLIGDYHTRATRSRAMSLHQSGVYAGTIAGGALAGWTAQAYGWRSAFWWFGGAGIAVALAILLWLREPKRGMAESEPAAGPAPASRQIARDVLANRHAWLLIVAFMGANFVAVVFLSWMPSFLYRKFSMTLAMAGWSATAYLQLASVMGVLSGGVAADRLFRRYAGARPAIQCLGLLCGVPFLFLTGWTLSVPVLVAAMACFGYFKGLYDANIFASLYEVVPVEVRAAAAGILNSLGWLGAGFAPVIVARASEWIGMSACISATSVIYLVCASLLWRAAAAAGRS
ncbi:MAG TPA: MFS transporter [Candidatus Acidoferrales bacterium]|nr:MFS transporter [Candidatus Acidoferrales bacterium]